MKKFTHTKAPANGKRPRVDSIKIKHIFDDSPHTDWLGTFTNQADPDDIKRHAVIPWKPGDSDTMDFFVPGNSLDSHKRSLAKMGYSKGEADRLARSYVRQDYERMKALDNEEFCMIGIQAEARVSYDEGQGNRRLEWFTSSGLWGIESDSGPDYLADVERQELANLKGHLERFNIDTSDFEAKAPQPDGDVDELEYH